MLAKIIAHGSDREEALERLDQALAHTRVLGVVTNIDFCRFVLRQQAVVDAELDTELLDRLVADYAVPQPSPEAQVLVGLARIGTRDRGDVWSSAVGWRVGEPAPVITRLVSGGHHSTVSIRVEHTDAHSISGSATVVDEGVDGAEGESWTAGVVYLPAQSGDGRDSDRLIVDGVSQSWSSTLIGESWWVSGPSGAWVLDLARPLLDEAADDRAGEITSPMPGTVVAVGATSGDEVSSGAAVVVVEAMKMEHALTAPVDGTVDITVKVGDKVDAGQILAVVTPAESREPVPAP